MSSAAHSPEWGETPRSTYRSRRDWSLRWWAMLAVIVSFVFHGMLYVSFEVTGLGTFLESKPIMRDVPDRIAINPELLKKQDAIQDIPETLAPNNQPDIKAFEPDMDAFDKASMIPDNREIDLTPNVKEITNFIRADQAGDSAPAQAKADMLAKALAPESLAMPDLAQEMASMRREVLGKPVSEKQMLLDAGALDPKDGTKMDMNLLDQVNRQGRGTADAASTRVKGFANIDDLISGGGQVGGSTGPILMPTDLLFTYGSDQLAEGARVSLMKLGFLIQKNPDSLFIIEGHTDSFGGDDFNLDLSQRRANAVVAWLQQSLRLGSDRIRATGMGKTRHIVDPGGTVEQQALNRRVEIKVRPGK